MNFSNTCEQTVVEGFLIEAFSSLEEAQSYHQLAQQRQGIEKVDTSLKSQDDSIQNNTREATNKKWPSLSDNGHMGMPEALVKYHNWHMNNGDTRRPIDISSPKDVLNNNIFDWRETSNKNGKQAAWTEVGTIRVGERNQVHSFIVDNRKMLASYSSENNTNNKEHFANRMGQRNANKERPPKEKTMSPIIAYPYTTSTLSGKLIQTAPSQMDSSHTICSSDVDIQDDWFKARNQPNSSYGRGSPLSHSLSAVSFASNLSYRHHKWNSFSKAEQTSSGISSKPEVTVFQRCENCGREHYGGFASGRFCSSKCARTVGGNARKRQRLEAQGIRFDDNGNPLDPIPKRLRYTPKHNVHREGDKPGKGYRLCIHCQQPTPNRKVKCQYCGEENPNAVRARRLVENPKKVQMTAHSDTPQTTSFTSPSATWTSTSKSDEKTKAECQQETMHSETEEEDDEYLVKDDSQDNTQHKKQLQYILNPC
ncbi:hypothetical protein Gasu2_12200 [Galdieria sulphuraria]|nr:hypothetical protein Gasu2_12200 [Galdieria sulphuraria]